MAAPRIIIIDDEERIRELLAQYLEDFEEYLILGAPSGEAALELLAEGPAELAVVDMRLPGMSGMEFIRRARERDLCRHFLIHTGSVGLILDAELKELGLTRRDLFFKPTGADGILDRIRELFPRTES